MKIYKGQYSLKDMLAASKDPTISIASTPIGAAPGERLTYSRRAAPWKGLKGIEAVRRANPKVAAGLENAIKVSQRHHEIGLTVIAYPNGETLTIPTKCHAMMVDAGHAVSVIGHLRVKRPWQQKVYVSPA